MENNYRKVEYRAWPFVIPKGVKERWIGTIGGGWPVWDQGSITLIIDRKATHWYWRFKMGFFVILSGKVEADSFDEAEREVRSTIRNLFEGLGI